MKLIRIPLVWVTTLLLSSAFVLFDTASAAELIDDFNDEDLSEYTQTLVVDTDSTNNLTFSASGGSLRLSGSSNSGIEQVLLLRDDHSLGIGQTLRADFSWGTSTRADIGIIVAATATPNPLVYNTALGGLQERTEDLVFVYAQSNAASLKSASINGTVDSGTFFANLGLPSPKIAVTGLYIRRSSAHDFVAGYTLGTGSIDVDFKTWTMDNASIGNAIGFFGDVRTLADYGALDNLVITLDLPGANLSGQDFSHANLGAANLSRANLSQANLTAADLTGANLTGATLSDAIFTDAIVKNAKLSSTHITFDQLYSTASYQTHDLTGAQFVGNDLSGADLAGQNLAASSFYAANLVGADLTNANLTGAELVNADLSQANLAGANLTNAALALANLSHANLANAYLAGANFIGATLAGVDIRGANLSKLHFTTDNYFCGRKHNGGPCGFSTSYTAGTGITLTQLVSTASYGAGDLSGVSLQNSDFSGGNFAGFNLTNVNFDGTTLVGADMSGADTRGAFGLSFFASSNVIRSDGHITGFNLAAGQTLTIRDFDGTADSLLIPIHVDEQLAMAADAKLRLVLEADPWDSTISFTAGISVTLDGTLDLAFATGVDPMSQIGRTFQIFDWTGVSPIGTFVVDSPFDWDLGNLYTTGQVTLLATDGYGGTAPPVPSVPEPTTWLLLGVVMIVAWTARRTRSNSFHSSCSLTRRLLPVVLVVVTCNRSFAEPSQIQLTGIGSPVWKPVDFHLFSAPATPFDAEFGQVYNTLLPYDTPLATSYVPHPAPYHTELSDGMIAGDYVSKSVFTVDEINLDPNGVYFAFMLVPDAGTTGSSRDFASGPVIPNSLFPIASNVDVWLDGVLVDRAPGADSILSVQPNDVAFQGTSHLESLFAIWHPWDDDLTVGPLGSYELRVSIRDVGGSGWDVIAPFQVVPALAGDYSGNGTVGPEDYAVWKANFGSTTNLNADGNDNHIVDAADFTVWRDNFGLSLGSGSSAAGYPLGASAALLSPAVPEPTTLALAIGGLLGLFAISRDPTKMSKIHHRILDILPQTPEKTLHSQTHEFWTSCVSQVNRIRPLDLGPPTSDL